LVGLVWFLKTFKRTVLTLKKMKDRRVKQVFSGAGSSRRWVGTKKGEMRVNMVDVLLSIYEDRRMKPVEIVLRSVWGGE
jgi:hypothetical protein